MRVSTGFPGLRPAKGLAKLPPDAVVPKTASVVAPRQSGGNVFRMPKTPVIKAVKPKTGNISMFKNRAMKSPEDYETAAGVAGLGKVASPYYQQQMAQRGQALNTNY